MSIQRIILTTGGTGGHIFPALAVAEEIRRRNPSAMLLFMGGKYGQEADLAVKAGLDFVGLPVRGVMGRGLRGLGAAVGMGRGLLGALAVMRKVKPQAVIGFGGYAAFAGVLAARLSGVPTAIHEQNAFPGMSNRLLGKMVDRIFLSMPDAAGVFPAARARLVGNPVRAGIVALYGSGVKDGPGLGDDGHEGGHGPGDAPGDAPGNGPGNGRNTTGTSYYGGVDAPSPFAAEHGVAAPGSPEAASPKTAGPDTASDALNAGPGPGKPFPAAGWGAGQVTGPEAGAERRPPRLLVMGGSLGARAINEGMIKAMDAFMEQGVEIRHQTGPADYERVRAAYRKDKAEQVRVEPFIDDVPGAYAWADLILCRAGASTLAEITAAGLPAVLVPFPQAAQDHQRHNAAWLREQGAAEVLEQAEFLREPHRLAALVGGLLRDPQTLARMSGRSRVLARPLAAAELVDGLEELIADRPGGHDTREANG